jgi:hypothetical protein
MNIVLQFYEYFIMSTRYIHQRQAQKKPSSILQSLNDNYNAKAPLLTMQKRVAKIVQ